jgi:hypothetical protein
MPQNRGLVKYIFALIRAAEDDHVDRTEV